MSMGAIEDIRHELKETHDCISRVWTALGEHRARDGMYIWDHVSDIVNRARQLERALDRMTKAFQPSSRPVGAPGSAARSDYDECVEAHAEAMALLKWNGGQS